MNCHEARSQTLIEDYLFGRLQEAAQEDLERHLFDCESCFEELQVMRACPSCGEIIRPDFVACPNCRRPLRSVCPSCDRVLEPGWKLCPFCGHDPRAKRVPPPLDDRTEILSTN